MMFSENGLKDVSLRQHSSDPKKWLFGRSAYYTSMRNRIPISSNYVKTEKSRHRWQPQYCVRWRQDNLWGLMESSSKFRRSFLEGMRWRVIARHSAFSSDLHLFMDVHTVHIP